MSNCRLLYRSYQFHSLWNVRRATLIGYSGLEIPMLVLLLTQEPLLVILFFYVAFIDFLYITGFIYAKTA
jgi:hypothetical protein